MKFPRSQRPFDPWWIPTVGGAVLLLGRLVTGILTLGDTLTIFVLAGSLSLTFLWIDRRADRKAAAARGKGPPQTQAD